MSDDQLKHLLAPIAPDQPCGEDLSFSPEFDRIGEMRRADDPTLAQGEWVRDIKLADFEGVKRLCGELLATRSKDLRLAAWMTDAMARTDGFSGMAQGLTVCARLSERFWADLHPQPDEDGFEQRVGNLVWLTQQLVGVAQTQPLIAGRAPQSAYSRRAIEAVRSRRDADHERAPGPSEDELTQALNQTPAEALLTALDGCGAALLALADLQAVVDGELAADGPNFATAREALQDTQRLLSRFSKERGLLPAGAAAVPTGDTTDPGRPALPAHPTFSGHPESRAQALAQLRSVAAFFRRTEPHSPVAYLADKAAQWGELPLHEWLRRVMKDQGALSHIEELLGIEAPEPHPND